MEKTYKDKSRLYNILHMEKYYDRWINLAITLLMVFGTIMISSTSVGFTYDSFTVVIKTFAKQIVFIALGYAGMLLANKKFKFSTVYRWQWPVFLLFIITMIVPFAFPAQGGSHAWIQLGMVSVQPSEFAKPIMIALVATALYKAQKDESRWKNFLTLMKGPLCAFLLIEVIIFYQKDHGTAAIIAGITFVCMFIPSHPNIKAIQKKVVNGLILLFVLAFLLFGITDIGNSILEQVGQGHVAVRIENTKNPLKEEGIYSKGYQPANSLYGIADSHVWGKGIGNSTRKYGYLTQADNDYILAITIEETGIFGLIFLVSMYSLILFRLFYYAFKTKDIANKVVLAGTGTYFFLHFFLNVGGVGAFIPMTGIPLLFISSGGSSLVSICVTVGMAQACIRNIRMEELKE